MLPQGARPAHSRAQHDAEQQQTEREPGQRHADVRRPAGPGIVGTVVRARPRRVNADRGPRASRASSASIWGDSPAPAHVLARPRPRASPPPRAQWSQCGSTWLREASAVARGSHAGQHAAASPRDLRLSGSATRRTRPRRRRTPRRTSRSMRRRTGCSTASSVTTPSLHRAAEPGDQLARPRRSRLRSPTGTGRRPGRGRRYPRRDHRRTPTRTGRAPLAARSAGAGRTATSTVR